MARSRNIKPAFFLNEDLVELPFGSRLLFIGLWCLADREGRLENRPKKIKMQLFPADTLDIPEALLGLYKDNLVTLYTIDSIDYIQVNNFSKHQNPHHKEADSVIPECADPVKTEDNPSTTVLIPDSLNPKPDTPITDKAKPSPPPYEDIVNLYHEILTDNPRIAVLSPKRKGHIKAIWKTYLDELDDWKKYFTKCSSSAFLTGRVPPNGNRSKPYLADIDFLIREATVISVSEGKYHR